EDRFDARSFDNGAMVPPFGDADARHFQQPVGEDRETGENGYGEGDGDEYSGERREPRLSGVGLAAAAEHRAGPATQDPSGAEQGLAPNGERHHPFGREEHE